MASRLEKLRARLHDLAIPGLLVTAPENIYYLSGFSGSSGALVITSDQQVLISDFRYALQVAQESPDWTFVQAMDTLEKAIREQLLQTRLSSIGFEPADLTFDRYQRLGGVDSTADYSLVPTPPLIEGLRVIKEPAELARIQHAVQITDDAYQHLTTMVKPGVTELELALEAEFYMRHHGADGLAFSIIIATGAHSALPHAQPGTRELQPGDLVVVDMGARYAHYCADMTRTFAVAHATETAQKIYSLCLSAQLSGIQQIHAGMTGQQADATVRAVIQEAGYGDCFGHGTGHGIGLAIHESPRLNTHSVAVLHTGSLVTIEPGIYLPDFGGVRIEDLVLITEHGITPLTRTPKPAELPVYGA